MAMISTFFGDAAVTGPTAGDVEGGLVHEGGRDWYAIRNHDRLPPFFMSLVSSSDHWWFVSSTGGMTAGRGDADHAFLPYETEDRITLGTEHTGPVTILRVLGRDGRAQLWEPLSRRPRVYRLERRLRKTVEGDALCLEERNLDLGLRFAATLRFGDDVGFVRTVELFDEVDMARRIDVLDGYRNVIPAGATELLQARMSCLLDAYKRSELDPATGVAFFGLSSTLTDRAEASEALRANALWTLGLEPTAVLLTPDDRVEAFRRGETVAGDTDVRGRRGAFLTQAQVTLDPGGATRWHVVADVACDAKGAGRIRAWQRDLDPVQREVLLEEDIARGTRTLRHIVGAADGLAVSGDELTTTHHFANTLFNVMRGGVFVDGHRVETRDFATFVATRNTAVAERQTAWLEGLPRTIHIGYLLEQAEETGDIDLTRLVLEYLPLTFSRRHGDPSRPWNRFTIRLRNPDGTPRTDYQGNWRDIFQNWEPLAYAFPAFAFSMVAKFLNATTLDGYNPYRVTRDGIEWEVPEPDNPWSNLGYWGDHQIIYLQKLLEIVERFEPGRLRREWNRAGFTYADVPYRLTSYASMVEDWSSTVGFDQHAHEETERRSARMGTDGRLVPAPDGHGVHHATMVEKLLVLLLAKLTNLVPGGGIWMNTQRPEWNDANNALVGKGVSVVTAAYLRRFVAFWEAHLGDAGGLDAFAVGAPVATLAQEVTEALERHRGALDGEVDDATRREVMDALGASATTYRGAVYAGASADTVDVSVDAIARLLDVSLAYIDHALAANRREDGLYHGYLTLAFGDGTTSLDTLDLMLEGQVAALSSGALSPEQALEVVKALPKSAIYWPEQHTYLLYPNRQIEGFLTKNAFGADRLRGSELAAALSTNGDDRLVVVDPYDGKAHFGGDLRNASDLAELLDELASDPRYATLVEAERSRWLGLFEEVFDHRAFTGRSGTFFAYEGLGSVYWHMVSKLLLAVQETFFDALDRGADEPVVAGLADAYYEVRAGLGFQKSPAEFGAFPTDPYSHTPETGQARQPGMTGLVKEEMLARMGELGLRIADGTLRFEPHLLRMSEGVPQKTTLGYIDVDGDMKKEPVPAGGLGFTVAQTPIVYELSADAPPSVRVRMADGAERTFEEAVLPKDLTTHVLARDGVVRAIHVTIRPGRV
jgi:hypothetical protein